MNWGSDVPIRLAFVLGLATWPAALLFARWLREMQKTRWFGMSDG